jgi:hypothetical protein
VTKTFADSENDACSDCNTAVGCDTCEGEADFCTSCISPKYLFNNTCVDQCPSGYIVSGNDCIQCNSECLTCYMDEGV